MVRWWLLLKRGVSFSTLPPCLDGWMNGWVDVCPAYPFLFGIFSLSSSSVLHQCVRSGRYQEGVFGVISFPSQMTQRERESKQPPVTPNDSKNRRGERRVETNNLCFCFPFLSRRDLKFLFFFSFPGHGWDGHGYGTA